MANKIRAKRIRTIASMKRSTAQDYAHKKRGEIINAAAEVENTLTDLITWCFDPSQYSRREAISGIIGDSGLALKSLLLRRIDFRDKIEILKDVVTIKKPDIMESDRALLTSIVKELNKVREFRNLLAHSESDLSTEFVDSSVCFDKSRPINKLQVIEYRKGKVVKHLIDEARCTAELKTMNRVSIRLWQLFALLKDDREWANKIADWTKTE